MAREPRTRRWRPAQIVWILVPVLALATSTGCRHHRSALRPIYATPAPEVFMPQSSCPPETYAPGFEESGTLSAPVDTEVVPQSGSYNNGGVQAGEPELDYNQLSPADTSPPSATEPQTRRDVPRSTTPTSRRATTRSRVAAFVNDPDDLFQPPKADRRWRYIVLHHSDHPSGSYAQIDRDHQSQLGTTCGYHFIVGNGTESPDGLIEVANRWSEQKAGAHCRDARVADVNDYGIGICLIGDFDQGPPTPKQVAATKALVDYLRQRYQIPAENIGTHAQLAHVPTACPGKNFPVEAILGSSHFAAR